MEEVLKKLRNVRKAFIAKGKNDSYVIYSTDELHELLAQEICADNGWNWKSEGFFSAEDYLIIKKQMIKYSAYGLGRSYRYIAYCDRSERSIKGLGDKIALELNLRLDSSYN